MSLVPTGGPYIRYIVAHGLNKPDESKLPKIISKEPIVGYRVWMVDKETSELTSCYKKVKWPFREKLVRGTKGDHLDLALGIHAAKEYKALIQNTRLDFYDPFPSAGLWSDYKAQVAGEVWLWGEVKECQHGWLAEFAYPKKLWMPENTDPVVVMQLEENYGISVELNPDFGEYKKTFFDCVFSPMPPVTIPTRSGKNVSHFTYPSVLTADGTIPPDTQIEIRKDEEKGII